jgi:hypothetical protein
LLFVRVLVCAPGESSAPAVISAAAPAFASLVAPAFADEVAPALLVAAPAAPEAPCTLPSEFELHALAIPPTATNSNAHRIRPPVFGIQRG